MKEWSLRNVVRLCAVVAALAPIVASALDTLPWEAAASVSAVVLVAGEIAQRIENDKTLRALLEMPPTDET